MKILGIETTCDETSVGIVKDGRDVLANVVSSSASLHKKYGGVVPEVAAREQVKLMVPVLDEVCHESGIKYQDIDSFAVAHGPGLVGSLLIGVETAKTLALTFDKTLIAVNHLVGHIYANWLTPKVNSKLKIVNGKEFPLVALIVSGGHTDLILMKGFGSFQLLGSTRDDAAGEVFDKVARVLGLGYPGGPEVERVAQQFNVQSSNLKVKFPRPMIGDASFDFSFSGLKTAVVNLVNSTGYSSSESEGQVEKFKGYSSRQARTIKDAVMAEIAYEFQEAIVDVLVKKTFKAVSKYGVKTVVFGGGVAANSRLRNRMSHTGLKFGVNVLFPEKGLSVDNGAMIAAAAFFEKDFVDPLKLQANPSLHF